jgi:hypothetical protein
MVEFFHQRTAVQFLSGSAMPDFHASPGAVGGRSPRNPTMAACSATGSTACVRRWRPSACRDGHRRRRGYGAFFNATRSPRSALYAARRLLRHGWQRLRAGRGQHLVNGNALVARLLRSALDAGVRFQLNAPVVRLLQGPPGVSGAVLRSDSGEIHVEAAPWCWPAAVFPTIGSGWRRWCPTRRRLRPFLRRTAGQSGRGIRLGESVGGQFDTRLRHPLAWAPVSRVTLASGQQLMFPIWWNAPSPG